MQNTGFPFGFFYFYVQYPCPLTAFPTYPSFILPKQGETISHDPVPSILSEQPQAHQKRVRKRTYRRLSQREKMLRKQNREDNFESKKQKKDRNIPSNIIRNFFQFLRRHPHLHSFLQRLTPAYNYPAIEGLILKLWTVMDRQGSYVRPSVLQALWNNQGLEEMEGVVFRMMLRKLMVEVEPMLLAGKESFNRKQKLEYLRCCRKLWQQLQDNHFP